MCVNTARSLTSEDSLILKGCSWNVFLSSKANLLVVYSIGFMRREITVQQHCYSVAEY